MSDLVENPEDRFSRVTAQKDERHSDFKAFNNLMTITLLGNIVS